MISEQEVQRVMTDLKLDRMQAINHIRARQQLASRPLTPAQILGKSALDA